MYILEPNQNCLPSHIKSTAYGLAAVGGNLNLDTVLDAYSKGYFYWFNPGEEIEWFNPDPRCVIFPDEIHVAKSMRPYLNNKNYEFRINSDFWQVVNNCAQIKRKDQQGTWIGDEVKNALKKLHDNNWMLSAEIWENNEMIGGLYGLKMGKIFFGESMFSKQKNMSKLALINLCQYFIEKDEAVLIDCQIPTTHLFSLGATLISRNDFLYILHQYTNFKSNG